MLLEKRAGKVCFELHEAGRELQFDLEIRSDTSENIVEYRDHSLRPLLNNTLLDIFRDLRYVVHDLNEPERRRRAIAGAIQRSVVPVFSSQQTFFRQAHTSDNNLSDSPSVVPSDSNKRI